MVHLVGHTQRSSYRQGWCPSVLCRRYLVHYDRGGRDEEKIRLGTFHHKCNWYRLESTITTSVTILISILQTFRSWGSNIQSSPAYGVFISQLIRYASACSPYECFILRAFRLSNKLLGQGYVKERLKSSLRKFYGQYGDLTKQYEVPLSRMLHDILDDDHIQWHPPLIRHYTNFWPLLIQT